MDVYRVVDKNGSSFLHEELCRCCAEKMAKDGFQIEFDSHLCKQTYIKDERSYYDNGSDDEDSEITCSLCCEYLISKEVEPLNISV